MTARFPSKLSPRSGFSTKRLLALFSTVAAILSISTFIWTNSQNLSAWLERRGVIAQPVSILGSGSMAPTFPIGEGSTATERAEKIVATVDMWRFPGGIRLADTLIGAQQLKHGDLVFIRDSKEGNVHGTNGVVKRVIGIPGDSIEIQNGFVRRNGIQLIEPYTLEPRSTFGGPNFPECTAVSIPPQHVFVLGDNRKKSDDSRHRFGMVAFESIVRFTPWKKQIGVLDSNWRKNAEQDSTLVGESTFSDQEFIRQLNSARAQQKLPPLLVNTSLKNFSQSRAELWSSSTIPATDAATLFSQASRNGYRNPLLAELPISGWYSEEDILEALPEMKNWSALLMSGAYQEIGIGIDSSSTQCPRQAIVISLGGYTPAQYDSAMVTDWEQTLARLAEVRPGWVQAERQSHRLTEQQRQDLSTLISIIDTRLQRIEALVQTMQRKEWLTEEQEQWLAEDETLAEQQFSLSSRLNSQ